MRLPSPRAWLVISAAVAVLMLALVHALESFGGYPPCELCLREREVVWTVLAIAVAGRLLAGRFPVIGRVAVVAVAVGFLVGAALGAFHAGVEWKWWPGPEACTGVRSRVSAADVAAVLNGTRKVHLVRCDEAALRIAGLSLAGWNALASLALAALSVVVLIPRRSLRA